MSVARHALTQSVHYQTLHLRFTGVGSRGSPIWGAAVIKSVVACRVAIFEKLATVSETSFDDADLLQLYQAKSLLDPPGVQP